MATTVSSKNQIVIPRAIRQLTGIKPGMKLYPTVNKNGEVVISTKPVWHKHVGALRGVWTKHGDPVELLRKRRDQE
jgi:AbrB family looped-hinge helix DNA binding protein